MAEGTRERLVNRMHVVWNHPEHQWNLACIVQTCESPKVRLREGPLGLTAVESVSGLEGFCGLGCLYETPC